MSASNKTLTELHGIVAKELTRRIEDGEATAADISAAIKFLKDNGIDCVADANENVTALADSVKLPFTDEDSEDHITH